MIANVAETLLGTLAITEHIAETKDKDKARA